jgi:hypothetical protein
MNSPPQAAGNSPSLIEDRSMTLPPLRPGGSDYLQKPDLGDHYLMGTYQIFLFINRIKARWKWNVSHIYKL